MRYKTIPARECINDGPALPMMLTLHPVYKSINRLTAPLSGLEAFTRTYLRTLVKGLV